MKNVKYIPNPDTIFNEYTVDDPFHQYHNHRPRFSSAFTYECLRRKGMMADYELKNAQKWRLEKRFPVENRYRFVGELKPQEFPKTREVFTVSRVRLSESSYYGLINIADAACGYYLVFHYNGSIWQRVTYFMSYIV